MVGMGGNLKTSPGSANTVGNMTTPGHTHLKSSDACLSPRCGASLGLEIEQSTRDDQHRDYEEARSEARDRVLRSVLRGVELSVHVLDLSQACMNEGEL